jgi:SAM-dependent methyltransferase
MTQLNLAEQYATDENLRIRIETHRLYTVGPPLEPAIDAALAPNGNEALLDIGAGPGDFVIRLRRSGHRGPLTAIDNSPGMVAKAKSFGVDIQVIQADAQRLPFPDESFDIVTARHMLYHVPDIPLALREAHRVLKPRGKFLAVTNINDNFSQFRQALRQTAEFLRGHVADAVRIAVPASEVFNEQNGPHLLQSVFGNVATSLVNAALQFDSPEPALRYFDSCRTMKGMTLEDWSIARKKFAEIIAPYFTRGPWTVSKTVVLLIATR